MTKRTGRFALTLSFCVVMSCIATIASAQSAPAFEPVPADKIDQAQKDKAGQVATTTLNNWFKGQYAPLSDDFTPTMKENLPPEAQKQATEGLKASLGDFQSLQFAEAVGTPSMPGIIVYRFRAKFSKASVSPEIRVVLDKQGKVAGLWVKPWQDKMQ